MSDLTITTRRNDAASRFEALVDGELAGFADFRIDGQVMELPHTETFPAFGGRGVASTVARAALDDARERGHTVVPSCSYIAHWIEQHPDYADLVAG